MSAEKRDAEFVDEMNEMFQRWKGRTVRDLAGAFGPPTRETSDEAGGRIFVYDRSKTDYSASGTSQIIGDKVYQDFSAPYEVESLYMYWISPDGIIYRGLWQISDNKGRFYHGRF